MISQLGVLASWAVRVGAGANAFTIAAAEEMVQVPGEAWPTPIARFDGLGGIQTKVGGTLCTTAPPKHPMRIVYESLFGCDQPTLHHRIDELLVAR